MSKFNPFKGKESKAEEGAEKKAAPSKKAYKAAEKKFEGEGFACGGKVKKFAFGGSVGQRMSVQDGQGDPRSRPGAGAPLRGGGRMGPVLGPQMPSYNPPGVDPSAAPAPPTGMKCGGKVKKYAEGGQVSRGNGAATRGTKFMKNG